MIRLTTFLKRVFSFSRDLKFKRFICLYLVVYGLPACFLLLKNLNVNILHCVEVSYNSDAQLNDIEYGMQVSRDCWTFGMHLDNYLEYSNTEPPIYLKKYHKNITRKNELTAKWLDEEKFFSRQQIGTFLIAVVQVSYLRLRILTI